ncbi:hypothetical protein Aperf_G00000010500 [Anoplocephala perfoliata]
MEDLHMADAESVSEAEFEAFSPSAELILEREKLAKERRLRLRARGSMDGSAATNSTDQLSTSSWESVSTSSTSLTSKSPPQISLAMPRLLADLQLAAPPETTMVSASVETPAVEDRALEDSLRWAGLQAALEAFKAKHPTLPFNETSDWEEDLQHLQPRLLQHYANELEKETGQVSEQLIACLAEREELRLFREVLDGFVVLHNALQHRRRKAADAVLANTTRFTLAHLKQHLVRSYAVLYRRMPHSYSPSSMIELTDLSKSDGGLGGSTVSLNLQVPEATEDRIPRGAHVGDPIEFPSLRSALSRLSGLLTGHMTVQENQEDSVTLASRVVANDEKTMRFAGASTAATRRLVEGAKRSGKKLPPIDLPWPMGRPECSQSLKLQIPIPSTHLSTWLPPRLPIINDILLATLQESPEVKRLLRELLHYDPLLEAQRLQRTSKYLSKSGFESAQVDSMQIIYSSNDNVGNSELASRKTVSFDWRGTKEPFKDLAAKRSIDRMNIQASPAV